MTRPAIIALIASIQTAVDAVAVEIDRVRAIVSRAADLAEVDLYNRARATLAGLETRAAGLLDQMVDAQILEIKTRGT